MQRNGTVQCASRKQTRTTLPATKFVRRRMQQAGALPDGTTAHSSLAAVSDPIERGSVPDNWFDKMFLRARGIGGRHTRLSCGWAATQ